MPKFAYVILSERHVKESNPRRVILAVQIRVLVALVDKIEGLREAEEEDDVDDGEGGHVSQDHAVDHRHERTGQRDCSEQEK